jgi:type III restriction enzyme
MRMPYAKARKTPSLNKAYAYVVSPHFGEAAAALTEKLINRGFDGDEAQSAVQQEPSEMPDLNPNWNTPYNQFKLSGTIKAADIPPSVTVENHNTLFFTSETTAEDIKKICTKINLQEAADLIWKFESYKKIDTIPTPASKGVRFTVPRLMFKTQGELLFADSDTIFEQFDWNISNYASAELDKSEFHIEETPGNSFFIDIDGNRLTYSVAGKEQLLPFMADVDVWTPANLIYWLDRNLKQEDIPQSHMLSWLRKIIDYLTEVRKISVSQLMIAKYALLNKLLAKIALARKNARTSSFELFQRDYRKEIDFEKGFEFKAGMYDGLLYYQGKYKFTKHFLGTNKIPVFSGVEGGEEFQCAQAIDTEPAIKFWLRNKDSHPASFRLPTSRDNFYPDFIAKLQDDRILVIEYKGEDRATNDDTKEKTFIGELWEKYTKGKGLFLLAVHNKDGKTVAEQIKEKITKGAKQSDKNVEVIYKV